MQPLSGGQKAVLNALSHGMTETVSLADLKAIMLYTSGRVMSEGRLRHIRQTRLCPGVYKVELTRKGARI